MWPLKKTIRQRRVEARKAPRAGRGLWERFRKAGGIGSVLLAGALFLAAAVMDVYPLDPFLYRLGQYLPQDIHARVRFRVVLKDRLDEAIRRTRNATPAVFQLNEAVIEDAQSALRELPRRLSATTQPAGLDPKLRKDLAIGDANQLASWAEVSKDANALRVYREHVEELGTVLRGAYIVRLADTRHKPLWHTPEKAILRTAPPPAEGAAVPAGKALDIAEVVEIANRNAVAGEMARLKLAGRFQPAVRKNVDALLLSKLTAEPLFRYDADATGQLMDAAVVAVRAQPPEEVYKTYDVGDVVASRSRQTGPAGQVETEGLGAEELQLLRAEHAAFWVQDRSRPLDLWGRVAGRAAVILVVIVLIGLYLPRFEPGLLTDHLRVFKLLGVLVGVLGLNKTLIALGLNPHAAVLPVTMAAVILTLGSDQRLALALGTATGLLVILQFRAGLPLLLVLVTAAAVAIAQLGEIRTRTKLIKVMGASAAAVLAATWIQALARSVPWQFALVDSLWAAGCALLVGFIVQGILPLIERVFGVATSMTLLEWCDASKPLLKRLAMEAPGTYNHSLQLGAMCETAAESVGARGLLARVGAYYHDIGKIHKPEYFIENQAGPTSKHAKLSPAMSLLIVVGHVKDGVEMAREYGLPKVLHEFVASHHGTTLVQYFYQAAAEQRKSDADRAPDEMEFRYPGPKPRSKEPAILMLADAAESSVRAMSEPTPGRIENQVHAMVTRRLNDGQLDECELTLKEVHQIETSLIKSLCSMYHARIAYPTPAGQKPSSSELHPRQFGEEPAVKKGGNGNGEPKTATGDAGQPQTPDAVPK